jgi:hypothetical protein
MSTQRRHRLDDLRLRIAKLEDATSAVRAENPDADPRALAAYLRSMLDELAHLRLELDADLGIADVRENLPLLWIRIAGGKVGEGTGPAHAIGKLLDAVQTGVRQVSAFMETGKAYLRSIPAEIGQEVALDLIALAPGSARIALSPASPQYRVDLPRPLAEVALGRIMEAFEWAEGGGGDSELEGMFPERTVRRQVLSRIREIAPHDAGDYETVEFTAPSEENGDIARLKVRLSRVGARHAYDYLARKQNDGVVYQGQLVAIDIEKRQFSLRHGPRRIPCKIEGSAAERAMRLVGEYVEVQGMGTFHPDDEVPAQISVETIRRLRPEEQAAISL